MKILQKIKNLLINIDIINSILNKNNSNIINQPLIVPREQHHISRKNINQDVLKVLYTLKNQGYQSYLVGGGVRDLLLGHKPKDFDVVTNAYPEKIKKLFRRCYIIGKRFQLVHVYFGKNIIEVATFRAKHRGNASKEGMILRDNVYGSIDQDVIRRDFTINALYYNIENYSLIDYVGGLKDLHAKQICLIGDPMTRYREDPVRILRAIRFAAKLDFIIHPNTAKPIYTLASLLHNVSAARLYDEYVKLFFTSHPIASFKLLQEYNLLQILFPVFNCPIYNHKKTTHFINCLLRNLNTKQHKFKNLCPAYLMAGLLWHGVYNLAKDRINEEKISEFLAYKSVAEQLLLEQRQIIAISKKLNIFIKDIWLLQLKLAKVAGKPGKRADKLINSVKFNTAFDFLLLRAKSGELKAQKISRWWSKYLANKGAAAD
jgi:poly(A) polymerase